jgi:hypothetical protein
MLVNLTRGLEESFGSFFAKIDVQTRMIIDFQNPAFEVFVDQHIEPNNLEAFPLWNFSFKNLRLLLLGIRRVSHQRCATHVSDFFED